MSNYKLLIDTNVFIGLEDAKLIDFGFSDFYRGCLQHKVSMFVHEAAIEDISRDKDINRRQISLSKLQKFEKITGVRLPTRTELENKFGRIHKVNDEVDVRLLFTLESGVVDFLVTQDQGIHDRVKHSTLNKRVLRISDALVWLRQTFEPTAVKLPLVAEKKAHEIDITDDIFDSLRDGYDSFDQWWQQKCIREHRSCWVIEFGSELAGICVRKDELRHEATVQFPGDKILKICTFKVKPKFRGEKLGELLLKQALWFAQRNAYQLIYVTTQPNQAYLIQVLEYYGFQHTITLPKNECVFEKRLSTDRLTNRTEEEVFSTDRLNYPRFVLDDSVSAYCVPIKGSYHRKLFPEIAFQASLPLFPEHINYQSRGDAPRTPGNTIRKVYICRANITHLCPGDVLFFYESKSPGFVASQCITSVGVLEAVNSTNDIDQLIRLTAKRSVFSEIELKEMLDGNISPVKILDFLLMGHLEPPMSLSDLVSSGVFGSRPPQSICQIDPSKIGPLKSRMNFGFNL